MTTTTKAQYGIIDAAAVPHCSIDDQHIDVSPAYRNIVQFMGEDVARKTIVWVHVELKPLDRFHPH